MKIPNDLYYTIEHEWIRLKNNRATIGITDFAQGQLGDVVFIELPAEGTELTKENTFGVVESVKTVSDIYVPMTGKVVAINKDLESQPELVNSDPYGQGWMIEIEFSNSSPEQGLLSADQYREQCISQE
jgi:glycine cleavage system H protein